LPVRLDPITVSIDGYALGAITIQN